MFSSPIRAEFWLEDDGRTLVGDTNLADYNNLSKLSSFESVKILVTKPTGKYKDDYSAFYTFSGRITAPETNFYLTVIDDDSSGNDDGIKLQNHGPWIEANNLYIDITAKKSDAVNVTWDAHDAPEGSPHVTANNAYITVNALDGNGYGLRANSSYAATNKSSINITNNAVINMTNGGTAVFAGVSPSDFRYKDDLDEGESGGILITFTGGRWPAEVNLSGETTIELGKGLSDWSKSNSFKDAGFYTRYHGVINANHLTIRSYGSGRYDVHGILAGENSKNPTKPHYVSIINVTGNTDIDMTLGEKGTGDIYALKAIDGSININEAKRADFVKIKGDIENENGLINVNFSSADSALDGKVFTNTESDSKAQTNLSFENGAIWNISGDSTLTNLTINDGTIHFGSSVTRNTNQTYYKVNTQNLKGSGGTLISRIDLSKDSPETLANDQLKATNVEGQYTGIIRFDGYPSSAEKIHSDNWLLSQTNGSMSIVSPDGGNKYSANGSINWWSMKFLPEGTDINSLTEDELLALNEKSEGNGKWYLVKIGSEAIPTYPEEPNKPNEPADPELPPEAEQIQNLGSSVAQAVGWLSEKNDLRRRLGEIRYGSQTGLWAKVFTRQDRAEGFRYNGFKQDSTGIHIGYDTFAARDNDSAWIVGGTFRYAKSDQEGLETAFGGNGKLDEYSGKVYATWIHDSGFYVDALAQFGYYDQEINGRNNEATGTFDANYHNLGFGTSLEIGKMFTLSQESSENHWKNHWFIEPQVELSYFYVKGEDFKTSTGLKVDQGNADFLTGRAGFVLGKKFTYNSTSGTNDLWYQVGLIGGVAHEFLGDQTIKFTGVDGDCASVKGHGLGGTSFYYGVTADWQVSDRIRIYGELDREEGQHYTKDFGVNIGLKYAF